jgi:hypothetical protein
VVLGLLGNGNPAVLDPADLVTPSSQAETDRLHADTGATQ